MTRRRDGRGRFAPKRNTSEQVGEVDPRDAGQRPADQTDGYGRYADQYEEPDYCPPEISRRREERDRWIDEHVVHGGEPYDRAPSPAGCLVPILIALLLAAISIIAFDRYSRSSPAPQPTPAVVPAGPVSNLTAFTEPVRVKLAGDRAKAAIVADAYLGFGAALRGKSGQRVVDSRTLEAVQRAYLSDVDALGGVAVGAEIDAAIGGYLGMVKTTGKDGGWEPITFDESHRVKLVEIVVAIAEAARSVK